MKKDRFRYNETLGLIAGIAVCIVFIGSCSGRSESGKYIEELARIDGYSTAGNPGKALKKLSKLRKNASSASQWLSIAKRERQLEADEAAVETLKQGLERIPSSQELAAVMVDTLTDLGRYAAACTYSSSLIDTPYNQLSAYAEIRMAGKSDPLSIDPDHWIAAASATGLPLFLRNAAVVHAMRGNFAHACETANKPLAGVPGPGVPSLPDDMLFRSTLCYDAGFYAQVLELLPPGVETSTDFDELSLMADAAWNLGNTAVARSLWERITVLYQALSPLPWYNLAVTEIDPAAKKRWLESMLALYPAYYPAVVRYVRSVPENPPSLYDPLETELDRACFRSLEMDGKYEARPVSLDDARTVLRSAIEKSANSPDIRLLIENLRMDWFESTDTVKSSSAMWKLLEQYPDEAVLRSWAVWYFLSLGDADTAFSLNGGATEGDGAFYTGLECALSGDLDRAFTLFSTAANSDANAVGALANMARIRERKKDFTDAVEQYSLAAGMAVNARTASMLHYEAARVLSGLHSIERAKSVLGYALELDPSNYRADILLRELSASD